MKIARYKTLPRSLNSQNRGISESVEGKKKGAKRCEK